MSAVVNRDKMLTMLSFFFSSRRRHTRCYRDWSSDVCSSDLGGEVLPRACWTRKKHSSGNGSQWTRTLVRAPVGGTEHRAVDWGCRQDPSQAGTQKEDRSRGRRSEERRVGKEGREQRAEEHTD